MANLYGATHDSINDYSSTTAAEMQINSSTSWAIAQILKLETKATQYHYYLSTGALNLSEINAFFDQANNEIGWNSTGATHRTGAHPELLTDYCVVVHGQDGDAFKVTVCPLNGSGTEETIATGQSATTKTGKTFQFMRRGDANVDRYAKGVHSHPMRMSAYPTLAQVEAFASSLDAATEFSGILDLSWPYDDNTTSTPTDDIAGATITQNNMPTDGSQWTLIAGGASGVTVNATGVSTTPALGDVTVQTGADFAVTGLSTTPVLGTVTVTTVSQTVVDVTGVSTTPALGDVTVQTGADFTVTGLPVTVALGTVSFAGGVSFAVTGLSTTPVLGTVTVSTTTNVYPTGFAVTPALGNTTVQTGADFPVVGLSTTPQLGTVSAGEITGVTVTGFSVPVVLGDVSVRFDTSVDITGFDANVVLNSVNVWGLSAGVGSTSWTGIAGQGNTSWTNING